MASVGELLTSAGEAWRFAPQARVQDLVRRAAAGDRGSLPAVARELAALPGHVREQVLGSLRPSTAAALRRGLAGGSRPASGATDTLERATSSRFAGAQSEPRPDAAGSPIDDLARQSLALVDLAQGSPGSSGGRVDLANTVRGLIQRVAFALARGASPGQMGLLAGELPRLRRALDQAHEALRGEASVSGTPAAGPVDQALQAAFTSADRLARSLGSASGSPDGGDSGATPAIFTAPDRGLKEDLAGFLGQESIDGGRTPGETRTWQDADGARHGTYEAGSSMYRETGTTLGDDSFSVDDDFLKPSGEAPGTVGQVLGGALDAVGQVHEEGSFSYEASVLHAEGSYSVGNENAYFAASGEVSVLSASVAGSGSIDISGGRLTAVGHVEASATLVEASGEIHAKLGPATVDASGYAYVGAKASADGALYLDPAHGVYAAKVQAKAFAGATAEANAQGSLGDVASGEIGVGVWAGVGARVNLEAGIKDGEFKFKLDLGAAIGVGFNIKIGFSINLNKIKDKLTSAFDSVFNAFKGSGGAPLMSSNPEFLQGLLSNPEFLQGLTARPGEESPDVKEATANAFRRVIA